MVAYSFKPRFAEPILAGTKRQTIRGDRKRHARPGEHLQLYTGMRTKHCRLLGRPHWDCDEPDDYDPGEDCGRWNNSRLGSYYYCRLAGTEFCDWDCPHSRARKR